LPFRTSDAETLSAEVLPLADACRFLTQEAALVLAKRRLGRRRRPVWLGGSSVEVARVPWGVVAVIAPANYPLFIPGVQTLQALVAGNAVVLKPGHGGHAAAALLAALLDECGLPHGLLAVLDESDTSGSDLLRTDVDKVVLTGSLGTGRDVMATLAATMTPAAMELSGCDAVFVQEDADIDLAARALRFGLELNGGFTCIAPRRVFVARSVARALESALAVALASRPTIEVAPAAVPDVNRFATDALERGARLVSGELPVEGRMRPLVVANATTDMQIMRADVAAPMLAIVAVDSDDQALALADACDYALGV
jgi:acyl-CoA reductase-like NAD-dependent aldehyde dehydrogenase